jgi:hypothetical protein
MALALEWERTLGGTNPMGFSHAEWKQHHRRNVDVTKEEVEEILALAKGAA